MLRCFCSGDGVRFHGGAARFGGGAACGLDCRSRQVGAEERARGAALRPGDTIGIVAPGSNEDIKEFAKAIRDLEKLGYRLKFGDSCSANYGYC